MYRAASERHSMKSEAHYRRALRSRGREHHAQCHPNALIALFFLGLASAFIPGALQALFPDDPVIQAMATGKEGSHETLTVFPFPCIPNPLSMLTGYGLALLVGGSACFTACCAGQCGCLALQAVVLDIMIIYPLNFILWVLFWVLTPLRYLWRHFLTWLVVPFISIFHMRPSFFDSGLDKFVLAVPFAFRWMGMDDIYDTSERNVRLKMRKLFAGLFPRLSVPDVILTNTLFRVMLGFAMIPLAWWLCDEMYAVPLSRVETYKTMTDEERISEGIVTEEEEESDRQVKDDPLEASGKKNKALEVTFVFPRCKFLVDARETYGDRFQGNRVCRRVCRLMIEEMTGRLTNHSWEVTPNLVTKRCTFTITTKPWNPEVLPRDAEEGPSQRGDAGGCGCEDKSLEW